MYSTTSEKRECARRIDRLLKKHYGPPPAIAHDAPLDVLVRTILSQNTSDQNSHRAFERLKERFPEWTAVLSASTRQIEATIRVGGLAKTKARRIKAIISQIRRECDTLSLDWLCAMDAQEATKVLTGFKGVGPKTIRCVLLFACGMDVFPVDTHIFRISRRIGLIPESASTERAHQLWDEFLPRGLAYSLHLGLIEHGRRTCAARQPKCTLCCLRSLCNYYQATFA